MSTEGVEGAVAGPVVRPRRLRRQPRQLQHLPPPVGPVPVHALPRVQLAEEVRPRLLQPRKRGGLEEQLQTETLILVSAEGQRARHGIYLGHRK